MTYLKSDEEYIEFQKVWGTPTLKKGGFSQFPNLLIAHLKEFGIDTAELAVILVLYSRRKESVTFIGNLMSALPMSRNTLDRCLNTLTTKGYLTRKYHRGSYTSYDLSKLYTAVKDYAKTGVTRPQKLGLVTPKSGASRSQELVSSYKENIEKKKEVTKNNAWEEQRKRFGKHVDTDK